MHRNQKKVGFITLGITLIFGGSLMLFTRFSDSEIFNDIFLLWPLFLIILGLEFILTKLYYDVKQKNVQLSPSGISIFLIIIILFTSFLWTSTGFRLNFNTGLNWNVSQYQYTLDKTIEDDSIPIEGVEKVIVENPRGDVSIVSSDGAEKIAVEVDFKIATNDKEAAEGLLDQLLDIKRGSTTRISIKNIDSDSLHSLQASDITIHMPPEPGLDITTQFGNVAVSDIKNEVNIRGRHGSTDISDIQGDVTVENEYGSVRIKQIRGNLNLSNTHGRVEADDVTGYAEMKNSYDETIAKNINKDLKLTTKHGRAFVDNIGGSVNLTNAYAPTLIYNVEGDARIKAEHSELEMENILGNIDGTTSYSTIRLENTSYENTDIKVETSYSDIIADSAAGLSTTDKNNYQEGSALNGDGEQKIRLKTQHGDIRVHVK
ncbi:MAG TPA: hypothetical protein VFD33_06880 [Bacillota bacterium]|nr:hypothetical protein [Bacillota bacterium]